MIGAQGEYQVPVALERETPKEKNTAKAWYLEMCSLVQACCKCG